MRSVAGPFARFLFLVAMLGWPFLPTSAEPSDAATSREITVQEAEALLRSALPPSSTSLPKFGIEYDKDASTPQFYALSALWSGEGAVSVMIGNYWVDRRTGDIWNAAICEELASSGLDALKKKLRKTIGLSRPEYKKLRQKGPMC